MGTHAGYDYVIVGAGSAGCVLAARLSADPSIRVLLIEAGGPDKDRRIPVPAAFPKLFRTPFDWNYTTEPQRHLGGRRMYCPRGRGWGGSSSINAMIYIRGHRSDYDHWRDLGNPGWSYDEVLPYFRRSEDQKQAAPEYHGVGGPLSVEDPIYINPISRAMFEACRECGYEHNTDFNGAQQQGFGYYQRTTSRGRRCSTAVAFLKPALHRHNLTVRSKCQVTRVRLAGPRAEGVEFVDLVTGRKEFAAADGEILLAGGAINSPQVLLLSGIGPAEHLRATKIDVAVDLPGVGQHLEDHLISGNVYESRSTITLDTAGTIWNLAKFLLWSSGPLTSNVAEVGAFLPTREGLTAPDLQLHLAPAYYMEHGFQNPPGGSGISLGSTLIHPASRGYLALASNDPLAPPRIQPNYLAEAEDVRVLVKGTKICREIARSKALRDYVGAEVWPGSEAKSDEQIAEHIRRTCETLYHPVGTCRMGSDGAAVVDAQLRVHGVDRLRVVDASIMPRIVGGNTNAPTIMIAEKGADLIRGRAPSKYQPEAEAKGLLESGKLTATAETRRR